MIEYCFEGTVDVHDLDYNGVARASSILKYLQTSAERQLTDGGMSYDRLYNEHKRAFLLSRVRLDIRKPLYAFAPYRAITYACESRGFTFLRCYRLESRGETVAEAISVWGLINTETHALVRVNDFELGLETAAAPDLLPTRFKLPSILRDVGGYGVHYGDLDQNRHMNNTRYPDMYANFLDMRGKMISSITISYQTEAAIGERMRIEHAENGGEHYFRALRGDGKVNSEARIILSDIDREADFAK